MCFWYMNTGVFVLSVGYGGGIISASQMLEVKILGSRFPSFKDRMNENRLRCLMHFLCVPIKRMPQCLLFFVSMVGKGFEDIG